MDANQYVCIISSPPALESKEIDPLCRIDTIVSNDQPMKIRISMCDYLRVENIPSIVKIESKDLKKGDSKTDLDLIESFSVTNDEELNLFVLLPIKKEENTQKAFLEEYSETFKKWIPTEISNIQKQKIGSINYLSCQIEKTGKYRISNTKKESKQQMILAPEGFGILEATILNSDSLNFPGKIVLGGKGIVFTLNDHPSTYKIKMKLIGLDGEKTETGEMDVSACFKKTIRTQKWEQLKSLKLACNGKIPEEAGMLIFEKKNTEIVSQK